MKKGKLFPTTKFISEFTGRDLIGFVVFLIIPLVFFTSDFVTEYRNIFYALLVVFVAVYTIVGQFFFEKARLGSLGKRLLALAIINTLVLAFVNFTGNIISPYFFVVYFLMFSVAIFTYVEIFILECLIILFSVFILELHKYETISLVFQNLCSTGIISLSSILAALPLMIAISSFVKNLEMKHRLLLLSKQLLAIEDIEDEAVLAEVDQGIIIVDHELRITKISKWVENNFEVMPSLLLGRKISELELYDAVTNKRLLPSDRFYENLLGPAPQELKWRVLYKNQYGKYRRFIIKQTPLIVGDSLIGFLLSIQHPPKTLEDIISSFNQFLSFRLSSNVGMIRNLLRLSKQVQSDPSYPTIDEYLQSTIQILNDSSLKNQIADGNYEITLSKFDLQVVMGNVINQLGDLGKISIWNISPLYKNQAIILKSDLNLCEGLLTYSLSGALYLSEDARVSMSVDEDDALRKPAVIITANLPKDFPQKVDILEPFFAGKLVILAKYKGSGLEFSNANLIARYLGLDYSAQVTGGKLVVKIIFTIIEKSL